MWAKPLEDIETEITKAGGKIVEKVRILEHGGAVFKLEDKTHYCRLVRQGENPNALTEDAKKRNIPNPD
jgi:hypothetical protein